jgi:hypothetical protein
MKVNPRVRVVNLPQFVILSAAKDLCIRVRDKLHGRFAALSMTSPVTSRKIKTACGLGWAALREIFDENAYARFLERNAAPDSRASYRAFQREIAGRKEQSPRCC